MFLDNVSSVHPSPSTSEQRTSDDRKNQDKKEGEDEANKSPARPSSPEPNCSICLSKPENKSFTDSCFHQFCFVCLVEWSKVKAVCPLCKQPFKSIIHNVRSLEDYDRYHIQSREEVEARDRMERFRYATTMAGGRSLHAHRRRMEYERQQELLRRPTRSTARSLYREGRQAATSAFRRRIYDRNMRVEDSRLPSENRLRYRDITPRFFAANPACAHRLVPWLNRELNVLLREDENRVQFTLELILGLIKRFDIKSPEFKQHLSSVLNRRTDHFIHEFHSFARSPYDMIAYDAHAIYTENVNVTLPDIDSGSDDDVSHRLRLNPFEYRSGIFDNISPIDLSNPPVPPVVIDHGTIVLDSDDEEYHRPSTSRWQPLPRAHRRHRQGEPTSTQSRDTVPARTATLTTAAQSSNQQTPQPGQGSTAASAAAATTSGSWTSFGASAATDSNVTVLYNDMLISDTAGPSASGWDSPVLVGASSWSPSPFLLRDIFGHSPGPSTSRAAPHLRDVADDGADAALDDTATVSSSHSSDIMVTGFEKPFEQRSPIPLSSGAENSDNNTAAIVIDPSTTSARKSSKKRRRRDEERRRRRRSEHSGDGEERHRHKRHREDVRSSSRDKRSDSSRKKSSKHRKHKKSRRHRSRCALATSKNLEKFLAIFMYLLLFCTCTSGLKARVILCLDICYA